MSSIRHLPIIGLALLAALAAPARAEVTGIDNDTLARLIDEGVPVIDIRRADEWKATGVIADSHLITFFDANGEHDASAWRRELAAVIDEGDPVVLICRSGSRTGLVSRWLDENAPSSTIYDVVGGIMAWQDEGRPTAAVP